MIIKFKIFEKINNEEPEIGDYVYCIVDKDEYDPNEFIGILFQIKPGKSYPYILKDIDFYVNVDPSNPGVTESPVNDNSEHRIIRYNEIVAFSKNKKDLEALMIANKYNL